MLVHRSDFRALGVGCFLAIVLVVASGQAPAERSGLLAELKPRMPVSLKQVAGRYEIGLLDGVAAPLGHEVVEVGLDHVVVKDVVGVSRIWIPVYSLASITTTRTRP